jgi:hypothetical protein
MSISDFSDTELIKQLGRDHDLSFRILLERELLRRFKERVKVEELKASDFKQSKDVKDILSSF